MEEDNNYYLHDYIIEKVEDFLKHDEISELYRYLKSTWENLNVLIKEIEGKIVWEEAKKKIIILKKYIKIRERLEKERKMIIKKTNENVLDVFGSEKSRDAFDERFMKALEILNAWELYNYLKDLYGWKIIKNIVRDVEVRLNWKIDIKKFKEFKEYVDERENLKKKQEKIKESISNETHDIITEKFEQFGRLSRLFSDWRKNPDTRFWEEYQKILWGEVSWNTTETPNLENVEVWNDNETKNLSWDKPLASAESGGELVKDYCLFNLIDRKSDQWFTLSRFINQNNTSLWERNSMNCDLVNAISNISLDNFCEQEWFYRWVLFDSNDIVSSDEWQGNLSNPGVVDFSKMKLMNPSSMTCEECMKRIRNSIAHWDFRYLTDNGEVIIYINDKINKNNQIDENNYENRFEALIDPSFFDDWFCFGQYASDISCDFILQWNNGELRKENIYEYSKWWGEIPKLVNFLWPRFKENLTTILDNRYNAVRINLNQEKWGKEMEIINLEKTQEPWLLFWLLSENERPYVHNLLNAISISILNKVLKNPNISYNELFDNLAVDAIWSERKLFTFQDRDKIIKLCLDMLPDLMMLQWLKTFYINMLEIPENNRTLEEKQQAHIRNALVHWYYKIVHWKIILWDEKINKATWGRDISLEKNIYDIEALWNEAKEYEKNYHSRKNGFDSLAEWCSITKSKCKKYE